MVKQTASAFSHQTTELKQSTMVDEISFNHIKWDHQHESQWFAKWFALSVCSPALQAPSDWIQNSCFRPKVCYGKSRCINWQSKMCSWLPAPIVSRSARHVFKNKMLLCAPRRLTTCSTAEMCSLADGADCADWRWAPLGVDVKLDIMSLLCFVR